MPRLSSSMLCCIIFSWSRVPLPQIPPLGMSITHICDKVRLIWKLHLPILIFSWPQGSKTCRRCYWGYVIIVTLHLAFFGIRRYALLTALYQALYAVDVSRPSVAWHLSCMAAQVCQSGGYHRSQTLKFDPPATAKLKRILFWHVYTLDKGLGLRLGRAPVIHECDIDIPRVFEFDGLGHNESSAVPTLWIKMSYLQSRIYEQL